MSQSTKDNFKTLTEGTETALIAADIEIVLPITGTQHTIMLHANGTPSAGSWQLYMTLDGTTYQAVGAAIDATNPVPVVLSCAMKGFKIVPSSLAGTGTTQYTVNFVSQS